MRKIERQLTRAEQRAEDAFLCHARKAIESAREIHHWGDGYGGYLKELFAEALHDALGAKPMATPSTYKGVRGSLRKAVYERDEYRCRRCGTHGDLTIDHIHPRALGGSDDIDNLQTLCLSCNCSKGARV